MPHKPSLILSALGIYCALGRNKEEVLANLFVANPQIMPCKHQLLSGRIVEVFKLQEDFPQLSTEFAPLNTRNNRLLRCVLEQIKPEIIKAKKIYGSSRIGIVMATTASGMRETEIAFAHLLQNGFWPDDFYVSQHETGSPALFAAQYLDILGPAYTISTACTSSSKAILSAQRLINAGICDAVICGGVDTLCELTLNGFDALELLATTRCIPFSQNRQGLSLGEGAAVFLLTKQTAAINDSNIVLHGGFETSDAYHISSPEPQGQMPEQAIVAGLQLLSIEPHNVAYANLHGTGTKMNDAMEAQVIDRIFGSTLPCSSTKSLTGHTLGAAGAIEAAILWLALTQEYNGKIPIPVHLWDQQKDHELPILNLVSATQRYIPFKENQVLISTSFAFGGSNVNLIIGKHYARYN
jgi:3-oxoacyl-[acyl-carrier-protein] synthase-1